MATQANHDQNITAIHCVTCNHAWDDEDDFGESYDSEDGEYYCVGVCLNAARAKAYRRQIAEVVEEKLREAMADIEALEREYKDCAIDIVDHPYTVLDDALMRAKMFGDGRDSGWRDGFMLSREESWDLIFSVERQMDSASFRLRWDLGFMPQQPKLQIGEYTACERARELAHLGNQVINLKAWRQRTEKGIAA